MKLLWSAVIIFFLFSNSFLVSEVARAWEPEMVKDEELGKYKIGIVLGGMSEYDPQTNRIMFNCAADRFIHAQRLYELRIIDKIMISGGSGSLVHDISEGETLSKLLRELNIPQRDIIVEKTSRNTYENAAMTTAILQQENLDRHKLLLITSASHMPRALGCFKKQGLDIESFPVGPATGPQRIFYFNHLFIPNAYSISYWEMLIHEWLGYISYWFMGYL